MNSRKAILSIAVSGIAAFAIAEDESKTIWQPGNFYHTHIAYEISIDNADLEPGAEKCYHGRYHIPHLVFAPIVEYTTSDIVRKGENFYAQRFYMSAFQTVSGLKNVKWKSDDWGVNPRRWINASRRYGDEDIAPLRELIQEFEKREKEYAVAKKELADVEKDLSKQHKKFKKKDADAKKELDNLIQHIEETVEGSKKRRKAEKKLEKVRKENEAELARLQIKLDEAKNRVVRVREVVGEAKMALTTEEFPVFYDAKHNAIPFSTKEQKLFLKWDGHSIENYFKGRRNNALDIKIGPMKLTTAQAISNGWTGLIVTNPNVKDIIASEFGVTASAIFDDPDGKLRLVENRKTWIIDAADINSLLATEELKKLISFKGTLKVERFPIFQRDCERVGLLPFIGWKVRVMDSSGAEVGYDTGDGYVPFGFTVSADGPNHIEFWFDANNEVLRYAKVVIEKKDYEGNIPNPNLGKMLSQVKGTAKGSVIFKCEYKTSVNQTLPGLDGASSNENEADND